MPHVGLHPSASVTPPILGGQGWGLVGTSTAQPLSGLHPQRHDTSRSSVRLKPKV